MRPIGTTADGSPSTPMRPGQAIALTTWRGSPSTSIVRSTMLPSWTWGKGGMAMTGHSSRSYCSNQSAQTRRNPTRSSSARSHDAM